MLYYKLKNCIFNGEKMKYSLFFDKIKSVYELAGIIENEPMCKHTTFQVGGNAEIFAKPRNIGAFMTVLGAAKECDLPLTVIGRGSNLLVSDKGIKGLVLCTCGMSGIKVEGSRIIAEAGATMAQFARAAYNAGLTGAEFSAGIPGTVGGGVFMNAGAYDGQLSDLVVKSVFMDAEGNSRIITNEEHEFDYRNSIFKHHPDWIIIQTEFVLKPANKEDIKAKMDDFAQRRRDKQPLNYPSAGSTFKRPVGHFAGKLIEDAGLKGAKIGGAMVSEKHAGFVINTGSATCQDVTGLINHIQQAVKSQFNVELECEVRMLGD